MNAIGTTGFVNMNEPDRRPADTPSPSAATPPQESASSPRASRGPTRRQVLGAVLATTVLAVGGGAAWAADRFLIPHVDVEDASAYEAAQLDANGGTVDDAAPSGTSTVSISTVVTGSGDEQVTAFVADVVLGAATDLRSAFADDAFGRNIVQTTSEIAAANDAVFAINGDYYGFRETGIVVRNGVAYRDAGARAGLAFYRDGRVEVYDETATNAQALVDAGVWNTLSFGPALLENGEVLAGIDDVEVDTNVGNHSIQGAQPRTAVGVLGTNHLALVVVDGRSPGYSAGLTMSGLAEFIRDLGATTAYNIDGGGSSTMVSNGSLVNDPLGKGEERGTSDILYIAA